MTTTFSALKKEYPKTPAATTKNETNNDITGSNLIMSRPKGRTMVLHKDKNLFEAIYSVTKLNRYAIDKFQKYKEFTHEIPFQNSCERMNR
jgi:hypothetical protein